MIQKIKNILFHLPKAVFYQNFYRHPSKKLTLIGITGTDGKTSTANLIYEILLKSGVKVGVITTISAKYNQKEIDTGLHLTSPDSSVVQKLLKDMVDDGITHVVCEVTAHALDQYRFFGCFFKIGLITNTSHEHLDYFHSMENYIYAKSKIFNQSEICILNKDDPSFDLLSSSKVPKFITYGINKKSDFQAKNINTNPESISFSVNGQKIVTDSVYQYQIYNILAALAVVCQLNIDIHYLQKTVKNFPAIKGRREEVPNNFGIKAIIDFAHTPNAIKNTLSSLKQIQNSRIIAIFGATGGRDQTKRPEMGLVASQFADIAIITSDDTRNEDIQEINKQIISGIPRDQHSLFIDSSDQKQIKKLVKDNPGKFIYFNIPNRQDAFNLAVQLANPKDTIIAMGKGHETSMLHGNTEYPWSESQAFRLAFNLKKKK